MNTDLFELVGLPAVTTYTIEFAQAFKAAAKSGSAQADVVATVNGITPSNRHGGIIAGMKKKGAIELVGYACTRTPQSHRRLTRVWGAK